jgi:hypothetical protein
MEHGLNLPRNHLFVKNILLILMVFVSFGVFSSFDPFKNITPLEKARICSTQSESGWRQYCSRQESEYNNYIKSCRELGIIPRSDCPKIYVHMKSYEPICKLCNSSPAQIYRSRPKSKNNKNDEDREEEHEDDSWFDEGTPQCDEGTYYERNGYC